MIKKVAITFSEEAARAYADLVKRAASDKSARMLVNAVMRTLERIHENPFYGSIIAHKLVPAEYIRKYDVKTLLRIELPLFWRMLYTVKPGSDEVAILAFVIDVIDHKSYDRKFGYKKR